MYNYSWKISRDLCSIHFRKNGILTARSANGSGAFRHTAYPYEPEVDELFLTHLLVLPSTRFFEQSVFDQDRVQRQDGGPRP